MTTAAKTVFVLIYQDKHVSPIVDGVSVYATWELAVREAADMVMDDLNDGKYDDRPEIAEQLRHCIQSEDWDGMMLAHEQYWMDYYPNQLIHIQEAAVIR